MPTPQIDIQAARQVPVRAQSSQQPRCQPKRRVQQDPQSRRSSAIVGELNSAYNDGTVGKFLYGREHVAETDVGIVHAFNDINGAPQIDISSETHQERWGRAVPARDEARAQTQDRLRVHSRDVRNNPCAVWDICIRATSWIRGTDSTTKQPGALDRCVRRRSASATRAPAASCAIRTPRSLDPRRPGLRLLHNEQERLPDQRGDELHGGRPTQ